MMRILRSLKDLEEYGRMMCLTVSVCQLVSAGHVYDSRAHESTAADVMCFKLNIDPKSEKRINKLLIFATAMHSLRE